MERAHYTQELPYAVHHLIRQAGVGTLAVSLLAALTLLSSLLEEHSQVLSSAKQKSKHFAMLIP